LIIRLTELLRLLETGKKADILQLSHYVLLSELGVTVEKFRRQSGLVNGVVVVVTVVATVVCGWDGGELLYLAAGQV